MIHVCFGLHDKTGRYSKFTGTAMLSMFENNPPPTPSITVHILHDNTLTPDNRDKFSYVAGRYGQLVKFYNVEQLCADKIEYIKRMFPQASETRFSIATFYRFFMTNILSADIDKVIYLDSDTIVNLDIRELWQVELGDKPLAAVPEAEIDPPGHKVNAPSKYLVANNFVGYNDYFNAGVLLLNLKVLRNDDKRIIQGLKFLGENPYMTWFDQDVLNYLYSKNYVRLPEKFDVFINVEREMPERRGRIRKAIYHYVFVYLQLDTSDPLNRLWLKYFAKTPWFDEDTIGRLYAGFRQVHVGLKNSLINLSAAMVGKRREFFAAPKDVDAFKKIFSIRNDEKIITADNNDSLNKLLDAMKRARGKKVFFIMLPNFPFQILTQAGFTPGNDFVNGLEFLSEAQGVPLNSYPLIQAM